MNSAETNENQKHHCKHHHSHNHAHKINQNNEKRTLFVIIFTILAMFGEILYGYFTNSMALLADGFHMGTHALALGLTLIAYILERKLANSEHFKKGTDKIGTLAGFVSSLFLGLTGFGIIFEAFERFINPLNIMFEEAIIVAVIGLLVNVICIFIMESKDKKEANCDYNFKAAYYHILADALTSLLALGALFAGKIFGIICFDSLIGILGGILILKWAYNLIKESAKILIDME